jgi:hypothetical protein
LRRQASAPFGRESALASFSTNEVTALSFPLRAVLLTRAILKNTKLGGEDFNPVIQYGTMDEIIKFI